jgi:hypothetical protein
MAIDSGLVQFLDFGPGSITASVGKVTGGTWRGDSAAVHRESIGAQDSIVGGPIPIGGDAEFMVANADLLAYALRSSYTSPSLLALNFAGGVAGDGRTQTGCYINTLRLRGAVGEPLVASIEWLGLTDAAYTAAAQTYLTDTVFEWFTGVVSVGSASLQTTGFEVSINNNLEHVFTMDAAVADSQRMPDAIHIGSQEVSMSCDVLTRPTSTAWADLLADSLATNIAASFAFTGGTGGSETLTIALSKLSRFTHSIPFNVGGGMVTYPLTFEAPKDSNVVAITCT